MYRLFGCAQKKTSGFDTWYFFFREYSREKQQYRRQQQQQSDHQDENNCDVRQRARVRAGPVWMLKIAQTKLDFKIHRPHCVLLNIWSECGLGPSWEQSPDWRGKEFSDVAI